MIPVEGHKGLFRDEESNAILNCNNYEYEEYLKIKNKIIDEKTEIDELKNEIKDLKVLLNELIKSKL
jgi:cell fate regulator YaaT (PSP1 superfamily)